ncbi:unnamed protein product [Adineta ricciae]|uniref:NAD(+)--protein-arginine ADP-ribosyltransferase n=1 Tax=Adineta ricciae TaxID=249248 RepID=A0A816DFI6_ADIRI|nr:unnamed protein product [Adineta ricciae]CAF1634148.1 unnamed protein product [Adineta ricciae]
MAVWNWILHVWKYLSIGFDTVRQKCAKISWSSVFYPKSETKKETLGEYLRNKIYGDGNCDLHDILREHSKTSLSHRHLKVNERRRIIEITERFHKNLKKLEIGSSIVGYLQIIDDTFFKNLPKDPVWTRIQKAFEEARRKDDVKLVIYAYTLSQMFTTCLNAHFAANAHHFLQLYCTVQNCPILSRTQEYIDAFSIILTHPDLDPYVITNITVYRCACLPEREFIDAYRKNDTILTTTLLSTSISKDVAQRFLLGASDISLAVLWIFNLNDTNQRSALSISSISQYEDEEEILILRYIPFIITSVVKQDGAMTEIYLTQCSEDISDLNQPTTNMIHSFPMDDSGSELELTEYDHNDQPVFSIT